MKVIDYRVERVIKVRPNKSYELLGSQVKLDKDKVYVAEIAYNQPNYEEKGLMFVGGILLNKSEYTRI